MTVRVFIDVIDNSLEPEQVAGWLDDAANIVTSVGQQNAPVDTGELRGSIHVDTLQDFTAIVVAEAPYAVFQEEGTSRGVPAVNFMEEGMAAAEAKYGNKLIFTKEI